MGQRFRFSIALNDVENWRGNRAYWKKHRSRVGEIGYGIITITAV